MTDSITTARGGTLTRSAGRIRRWQRQLSDRVHAGGDDFARRAGWSVTPVTGRAGFGGRIYHDPRFSQRNPAPAPAPADAAAPPATAGSLACTSPSRAPGMNPDLKGGADERELQ